MPPLLILATILLVILQFTLPQRWAFVPLFIAVFHLGDRGLISEFTPVRCIFIFGIIRAMIAGSITFSPGRNKVDLFVLLFSIWAVFTAPFHPESEFNPYTERLGLVLNVVGTYLYGKAYLNGEDIIIRFAKALALIMIPLALMMFIESTTGHNYYKALGARSAYALMRGEELRAKGPFGHAIIAGTAGACFIPLMFYLRRGHKMLSYIGIGAATLVTISTASSGPIAAYGISVMLLVYWRWRHTLKRNKRLLLLTLIILNFTMSRPIWFLIARIDLVGGSTGWHRSKLIDQAMRYIDDWWLWGTDYTRHWMFSGVSFSKNHTDITNYYLQMAVWGGLPLMILFLIMIYKTLRKLEDRMVQMRAEGDQHEFGLWCIWIAIIAQCVSFISIAYFDQSYALFFTLLGMAQILSEPATNQQINTKPTNPTNFQRVSP